MLEESTTDGEERFTNGDHVSAKEAEAALQPGELTNKRKQGESALDWAQDRTEWSGEH